MRMSEISSIALLCSSWIFVTSVDPVMAQLPAQTDAREITPGAALEREIKSGERHSYRITLRRGQYLRLMVGQHGVNVLVEVYAPGGGPLFEVDNQFDSELPEYLSLLAEPGGEYGVVVRPADDTAVAGKYGIQINELRDAEPRDATRYAAEKAVAEAQKLRRQSPAESKRRAVEKFESALPLWRELGDRMQEGKTIHLIGLTYANLTEMAKAMEYYNRALPIRREVGDRRGEGETLNNIATTYWWLGDQQKALEFFGRTLPIRREVADLQGEGSTLGNMGVVYIALGEYSKALDTLNQALLPRRKANDRAGEAETLGNIGAVYSQFFGEPFKAIDYLNRSLELRRAVGDQRATAHALAELGNVYLGLGELQKSMEYCNQSLPLWRLTGDRRGEGHALAYIAASYSRLGDLQKALDYDGQALTLLRASADPRSEVAGLQTLARDYRNLGDFQMALAYYNQVIQLSRTISAPSTEAAALLGIGEIHLKNKSGRTAMDSLSQGLAMLETLGERRLQAEALYNLGLAQADLGNREAGLDYIRRGLELQRAMQDRSGEAQSLLSFAELERGLGNLDEARANAQSGLDIIESLRTKVDNQDLRASYLALHRNYYEFYIDLLMQLHRNHPSGGHDAEALLASERARSRSLMEMLVESHTDIREGIDPALRESEQTIQQRINAKAELLTKLLGGKQSGQQSGAVQNELDSMLGDYQDLQARIRSQSPRYAALTQPRPLALAEIQKRVVDSETLLLEYALGSERSYLWVVGRDSIASFELPKRVVIESAARRFHELTALGDRIELRAQTKLAAAELSKLVLAPAAGDLKNKRLVIVADGALQYVPFGALPVPSSGDPQLLIAAHEILSVPSASVLAVLRQETPHLRHADKDVAVFADPVLDVHDPRLQQIYAKAERPDIPAAADDLVRSASELGIGSFERLRFSRREADAIAALSPPNRGFKAVGFDASRAIATSADIGRYRIVHFATHGLINTQHPELSGVVLSLVDRQGKPQDGFLRLHDIYNLKLAADMVVLSACRTALGKDVKGEGLIGLTRGFMYAGAQRVVASLWNVRDEATAELMKRFYEGMLKRELRPAAALRAAQVSMSKEKRWEAPYYWAGFVLQGEWR